MNRDALNRDSLASVAPFNGTGALLRPAPGGNAWLITFVDVVMLLLTFFILLYAMSKPEPARYATVAQSYIEAFKPVPDSDTPAATPRSYVLEPEAGEGLAYLENVLKTVFGRAPGLSDIGFRLSEQSLILSLPSEGVIDQAGLTLTQDMTTALFDLGGVLANIDNRIAVHGFVEPGDASAQSWSLAIHRADVVASALSAAGYDRPITASARTPGPNASVGSDIEIVIMAQDDVSQGDAND